MKITKEHLRSLIRKQLEETYRRQGVGGWSREGYETGRAPRWDQFDDDDRPGTQYERYKYIFRIKNEDGTESRRSIEFSEGHEGRSAEEMGEGFEKEMQKKYGEKFLGTVDYAEYIGTLEI